LTIGYIVHFGAASKSYTSQVSVGLHNKFRVDGLADDKLYCFAVQAYDAAGSKSALSAEVCGRTPAAGGDTTPPPPSSTASEIVVYSALASKIAGNWTLGSSSGAAGGVSARSTDRGWSAASAALASPADYFELPFTAKAGTPYRVWLRLRAAANSKWNDSVYVQFTNSLVNGSPGYRIGSTSALNVTLERCENCGVSGWGWSNSAYWLTQTTVVTFPTDGTQKMRIQTREDGVEIDHVVLSPAMFMSAPPGSPTNDTTIVPLSLGSTAPAPAPSPTPSPTPYSGTPKAVPSVIDAALFDNGGAGVAYFDTTAGNSGGAFRATDVDLQASSLGGYNITATAAGEWVTYTVNVPTARTYTLLFRVASVGGGVMEFVAGAPSNKTISVTVPNTGGAQVWTYVYAPAALAAGQQRFTVRFKSGAVNFRSLTVQ
jgi:hypothetical protein